MVLIEDKRNSRDILWAKVVSWTYAVTVADVNFILKCDTSWWAVTINFFDISLLPTNSAWIGIVDDSWNAGTNNITINAFAWQLINGNASLVLNQNNASTEIQVIDGDKRNATINDLNDMWGTLSISKWGTGATTAWWALSNLWWLSNVLANTNIFVGNAWNIATGVAMSWDATISNTGVLSLSAWNTLFKGSTGMVINEDWIWGTVAWRCNWSTDTSWAGSTVTNVTTGVDSNHPWVIQCRTSSATWRSGMSLWVNNMTLGGWTLEYRGNIQLVQLSVVAQEFIQYIGLGDNTGAGDMTDGVYFVYDRLTSVNRQIRTASGGTITNTITTTAVVAGSWIALWFIVNAAWTSVEFFINWVSVWTIVTNIPIGANLTNPLFSMKRSAGTNNLDTLIDYYTIFQPFTSSR